MEEQARYLLPDAGGAAPPDETTLLSTENGSLPVGYRRGIIGKRDRTLDPMIPAGSLTSRKTPLVHEIAYYGRYCRGLDTSHLRGC